MTRAEWVWYWKHRWRAKPALVTKPVQKHYVYFIECAGFVKVGVSSRPQKRFVGIQVSNPFDCTLIGTIETHADGERMIHDFIEKHHHRGEWYRLTDDLRALIAYLLAPDTAPKPGA